MSPLKGPPSGQNLLHVAHRKLKSNLSNYVDNKLKKIHENVAVINSGELSKDQTRRSSSLSLAGANIINEVDEYEKEIQSSMEFVDNDNDNDNGYEFNFDVDDIDYQDEANSPSALWSRMNTRLNFLDSFMEIGMRVIVGKNIIAVSFIICYRSQTKFPTWPRNAYQRKINCKK